MHHETINYQETLDLFHEFMGADSPFRVLRLLGDAKMGKSHLLTKVFPVLAKQVYQARCAIIDLRGRTQGVPDFLHLACSQFGSDVLFRTYYAAHRELLNRPRVELNRVQAFFSLFNVSAKVNVDDSREVVRHLTRHFITDLSNLDDDVLMLLIFDTVDGATEATQNWLMDTLLVGLASLDHLRVIVGGRSVPEASGSYAVRCCSHELLPVEEEEEYIGFCRRIGAELEEQSIRDFARAFGYKPGLFADFVLPTFVRRIS